MKLDAPTRIVVTSKRACALVAGGAVSCFETFPGIWDQVTPARIPGLDDAIDVGLYLDDAYALRRGGAVVELSLRPLGTLGPLSSQDDPPPPTPDVTVPGAVQLAIGAGYRCVRTAAGAVWCWGSNWMGRLGNGTLAEDLSRPVGSLAPALEIASGSAHVCARHAGGDVSCWGSNQYGQVGISSSGMSDARPTPVHVPGVKAEALATGPIGTCAITTKRELVCWGSDSGPWSGPHRMWFSAP